MRRRSDLTGAIFNHLEVLECVGVADYGQVMWRCQCHACGRADVIRSSANAPKSFSCGCTSRPRGPRGAGPVTTIHPCHTSTSTPAPTSPR